MGYRSFTAKVIVLEMKGSNCRNICRCGQTYKRSVHMQVIFAGISILIFFVTTVSLSTLTLSGWLKAAIIIPLVFLVVYSLARIQPKKLEVEKDTNK